MALMDVVSFVSCRWPLMAYAAGWTAVLTVAVAVASFSPEAAFVSAISPQSASPCKYPDLSIRLPLDIPAEILCFPAHRFSDSNIDLIVPPIFAALVVAASACLVRAVSLWEDDPPL